MHNLSTKKAHHTPIRPTHKIQTFERKIKHHKTPHTANTQRKHNKNTAKPQYIYKKNTPAANKTHTKNTNFRAPWRSVLNALGRSPHIKKIVNTLGRSPHICFWSIFTSLLLNEGVSIYVANHTGFLVFAKTI